MRIFLALILIILLLTFALVPSMAQSSAKSHAMVQQEGNGLWGEYYNGTNFEEKIYSRFDEEINFYNVRQSPAPGVHREHYSIRWTGSFYAPLTGLYKVSVRIDDGIRMWIDGVLILDEWRLQRTSSYSGQMHLVAGEFYDIKIEYFNGPIHGVMQLMWIMPEEDNNNFFSFLKPEPPTPKPIPKRYLYGKVPVEEPALTQTHVENKELMRATAAPKQEIGEIEKELVRVNDPKIVEKEQQTENGGARKTELLPISAGKDLAQQEERLYETLAEEDVFKNLKSGDEVQFMNVHFEQGKFTLLAGSTEELNKLIKTMKRDQDMKIRIEGHTDNVGIASLNQSLSYFRAKVVATYLIEHGIDPARIEATGKGSDMPIADNDTEEGKAKNRRVQFVVR